LNKLALGIDQKGTALDPADILAVHFLLFDHAVGVAHHFIGVGDQRKG